MLTFIPNEKKTGIQFLFEDFDTKEQQFITAFDLDESEKIGKGLIKMIKEIKKAKK